MSAADNNFTDLQDLNPVDDGTLHSQISNLGLNLDLLENSEDFYISSEGEYEWESEEEEVLYVNNNAKEEIKTNMIQSGLTANQVALIPSVQDDDDDEDDIESEEERDLLKGIKDEIEQKVREEMKSELEMYKEKIKAIENGKIDYENDTNSKTDEDLAGLDPKIKEGLIKMRKLDRILNKKLKREKEVKKDRILLERKIREEIADLKKNRREHREVQTNTDKYLLLALPPSHNEGVIVDEPSVTPVFQTQVEESNLLDKDKHNNHDSRTQPDSKLQEDNMESLNSNNKKKKKKKDFIKRNKELASHAEDKVAMTQEETSRVTDLLTDLDTLPEESDGISPFTEEINPFQVAVRPGEGFLPDNIELRSLVGIDSQLKHILPSDEYDSLIFTPVERSPQCKLFTRVGVKSSVLDFEIYGERVLLESKEERDMKEKLKRIEDELALFSNPREMKLESPSLSGDQLNELLDQCARSMSRSSYATENESLPETTPRSLQSTSRSSIYDNPPVLPHDVLQKLLAEAYCPISSKLSSVSEMEEDSNDSDTEFEPISAETWRIVAEQPVDEEEIENLIVSKYSASDSEEHNQNIFSSNSENYKPEYKDKRPFLPEINKSPFLISQGLNNEASFREVSHEHRLNNEHPMIHERCSSNGDQIEIIRNSLRDSSIVLESFSECGNETGDATPTPRPPSCDKRSLSNLSNRSVRTLTPTSGNH